jgi:predicted nucleic acid-binding Zn ribbon protein
MERDPATCPGLSQFVRPEPEYVKCPRCGGQVEIWSDEEETECDSCGATVARGMQSCLDWCEYADQCRDIIRERKRK